MSFRQVMLDYGRELIADSALAGVVGLAAVTLGAPVVIANAAAAVAFGAAPFLIARAATGIASFRDNGVKRSEQFNANVACDFLGASVGAGSLALYQGVGGNDALANALPYDPETNAVLATGLSTGTAFVIDKSVAFAARQRGLFQCNVNAARARQHRAADSGYQPISDAQDVRVGVGIGNKK